MTLQMRSELPSESAPNDPSNTLQMTLQMRSELPSKCPPNYPPKTAKVNTKLPISTAYTGTTGTVLRYRRHGVVPSVRREGPVPWNRTTGTDGTVLLPPNTGCAELGVSAEAARPNFASLI